MIHEIAQLEAGPSTKIKQEKSRKLALDRIYQRAKKNGWEQVKFTAKNDLRKNYP